MMNGDPRPLRRILWCYCGLPLTSLCFLWSRQPMLRFHAWQAWYLGVVYIGALAGIGLLEVTLGAAIPLMGRSIEYGVPAIAAIVVLFWLSVVLRLLAGGHGRLPVVGAWADARVGHMVQ